MSNTNQGKPAGKSGRRNRKGERGKKAVSQEAPPESPAPVQLQSPDQDQQPKPEPVHAESAKLDKPAVTEQAVTEPIDAVAAPIAPQPTVAPSPAKSSPAASPPAEPSPTEPVPVSMQTIANAYRDYTRKSFEEFGSFFEQLSGARSLEKAMSVHNEFVKRAYETSVAESQKIYELHSKLARQTLQPLQGLVGKARETHGKS